MSATGEANLTMSTSSASSASSSSSSGSALVLVPFLFQMAIHHLAICSDTTAPEYAPVGLAAASSSGGERCFLNLNNRRAADNIWQIIQEVFLEDSSDLAAPQAIEVCYHADFPRFFLSCFLFSFCCFCFHFSL